LAAVAFGHRRGALLPDHRRAADRPAAHGGGVEEGEGTARVLAPGTAEDLLARRLVLEKYQRPGSDDLDDFARTAMAVAVDLNPAGRPASS
jgi:hypothetical protein